MCKLSHNIYTIYTIGHLSGNAGSDVNIEPLLQRRNTYHTKNFTHSCHLRCLTWQINFVILPLIYVSSETNMYRMNKICIVFGILILVCTFISCTSNKQKENELIVFAAMSLKDALTEIKNGFSTENQATVYFNFAASTTLQRQIEKGASADIFISASSNQIDALERQGLLEISSRQNLLSNRLVVVSNKSEMISIDDLNDLTDPAISLIAIGQPEIVPAGSYAREALIHHNLWDILQSKLVFGIDVRSTLAYVSTGNVDLSIVYRTDTAISSNVKVVFQIPTKTHKAIIYPASVLKSSANKTIAVQFITYLKTKPATAIFERHNFSILSAKTSP